MSDNPYELRSFDREALIKAVQPEHPDEFSAYYYLMEQAGLFRWLAFETDEMSTAAQEQVAETFESVAAAKICCFDFDSVSTDCNLLLVYTDTQLHSVLTHACQYYEEEVE